MQPADATGVCNRRTLIGSLDSALKRTFRESSARSPELKSIRRTPQSSAIISISLFLLLLKYSFIENAATEPYNPVAKITRKTIVVSIYIYLCCFFLANSLSKIYFIIVMLRTIHLYHMCSKVYPQMILLCCTAGGPNHGSAYLISYIWSNFPHRFLVFSPESRLPYKVSFHYILVADWWITGGC